MPIYGRGRKLYYNPSDCFDAWLEQGTLKKAAQSLYDNGKKSKRGGIPPMISVQKSSKLYVTLYPEDARDKLVKNGYLYLLDPAEWTGFQIRAAASAYGKGSVRFKNWLVYNKLWEIAVDMKLAKPQFDERKPIIR